ncbi:MAG: FKBP-type peptidyl-prolyl cis-trans isomerase [Rickettsiales bacterium]
MFNFFKKKPDHKPVSPVLVWAFFAFLIYAFITNGIGKKNHQNAVESLTKNHNSEEALSLGSIFDDKKIINIEPLKGKLFPVKTRRLSATDAEVGEGDGAICGQKVTINYRSFAEEKKNEDSKEQVEIISKKEIENKKAISFIIGAGESMPALEKAVIGMKKGGKRNILSPHHMAYGADGFNKDSITDDTDTNFEVEMVDISPKIPDISAFKVLNDAPYDKGAFYSCGDEVKLNISIWDIAGNKLYDNMDSDKKETISFTIGASDTFFALEQGVLGLEPGKKRVIIAPPSTQKPLIENSNQIKLPLPKEQTAIIYIEAIP